MDPLQLCQLVVRAEFYLLSGAALAVCSSLIATWRLWAVTRYLRAALDHELQRRISSANETWKMASTAFASGEPISLDDLLSKREADFSLRSSEK